MLKTTGMICLSFGNTIYTLSQFAERAGIGRKKARHRLWKLEKAGLITRITSKEISLDQEGRLTRRIAYRNTASLKAKAKAQREREPNGWDKMWLAIRVLRRFTRNDLAVITGQNISNVCGFTQAYRKEGYLRRLGKSGEKNGLWEIAKDAGPKRPGVKRAVHVD